MSKQSDIEMLSIQAVEAYAKRNHLSGQKETKEWVYLIF